MKRAIKAHYKDFIAITVLVIIALATLLIILSNQKAALPSWIPGLGQEFYSINAEFETAQAITPGQGQAAVIAGINVGKVGAAELRTASPRSGSTSTRSTRTCSTRTPSSCTRPKTGLNDMVIEIDPGTTGPPPEEGSTLPLAQGMSNVQLEQFWATLDRDTQDYLVLLLNGAGVGLDGKGRELMQALRRFGPFTEYTARLNGLLEKRRENISGGVSALSKIAIELGNNDEVVADFITNSKNNLQAWADEEASLREALIELPPTLLAAQDGLAKSNPLSLVLRPTLLRLIPGAKNLKSSLIALQNLGKNVTPLVRDDIRPFTTGGPAGLRGSRADEPGIGGDHREGQGLLPEPEPPARHLGLQPARRRPGGLPVLGALAGPQLQLVDHRPGRDRTGSPRHQHDQLQHGLQASSVAWNGFSRHTPALHRLPPRPAPAPDQPG